MSGEHESLMSYGSAEQCGDYERGKSIALRGLKSRLLMFSLGLNCLIVFGLVAFAVFPVTDETDTISHERIAGKNNRIWMNPDFRDGLNLLENHEEDVLVPLQSTLASLKDKVDHAFTSNDFVNVSGYQVSVSVGCFDLLNYASGSGYQIKHVSDADMFLPIGAKRPKELKTWLELFEWKEDIGVATPFRSGSVTKVFTSLLAFILAERGVISLDDEFVSVWPEMAVEKLYTEMEADMFTPERNFTVRMAMSHMTGGKRDNCEMLASDDLIRDMKSCSTFSYPQNFHIEYNNFMTSLVGKYMAYKTEKSYGQLLKEYIFEPLGMNETYVDTFEDLLGGFRLGHDLCRSGQEDVDFSRVGQDFGSIREFNPAGSLISTARDLLKFIQAINPEGNRHQACLKKGLKPVVSRSTLREYLSHGVAVGNDYLGIGVSTSEMLTTFPFHHKYWTKGGAIGHYGTHVGLVPDAHLSVSLTSNTMSNVPPAVLSVFEEEENLVQPVLNLMKDAVKASYSGTFNCYSGLKHKLEDRRSTFTAEVSVSALDGTENPNEHLVISFDQPLEESDTSEEFKLAHYGLASNVKSVLGWNGNPHSYNIITTMSLGLFGGYLHDPTTISESMGARYTHRVTFIQDENGSKFKASITLGSTMNTKSAFHCMRD